MWVKFMFMEKFLILIVVIMDFIVILQAVRFSVIIMFACWKCFVYKLEFACYGDLNPQFVLIQNLLFSHIVKFYSVECFDG